MSQSPQPPRAAERILTTAEELFYRDGPRAVGVDEIVARAGVTKPTLYRAFQSKDGLIAAYMDVQAARFWSRLEAAAAKWPADPRGQLLAIVETLVGQTEGASFRGCALMNAAVAYAEPKHPARRAAVKHREALRERLRELTRAMDARKPKQLADAVLLLIEGALASSQVFGDKGPAGAALRAVEVLVDAHRRPSE